MPRLLTGTRQEWPEQPHLRDEKARPKSHLPVTAQAPDLAPSPGTFPSFLSASL